MLFRDGVVLLLQNNISLNERQSYQGENQEMHQHLKCLEKRYKMDARRILTPQISNGTLHELVEDAGVIPRA